MALRLPKNILMPLRTSVLRTFATAAEGAHSSAHEGSQRMWMLLSIFVAFPCTTWVYFQAKAKEEKEAQHPRPEFVPYAHLRVRTKRFPWGDGQRSLFHNPKMNALPDGYEE